MVFKIRISIVGKRRKKRNGFTKQKQRLQRLGVKIPKQKNIKKSKCPN